MTAVSVKLLWSGLRSAEVKEQRLRKIQHALSGAVYEWADDDIGPVLVTDRHGVSGRFDRDGRRIAGDLATVDPELCRWVASGGRSAGGAASRSRRFDTEEAHP